MNIGDTVRLSGLLVGDTGRFKKGEGKSFVVVKRDGEDRSSGVTEIDLGGRHETHVWDLSNPEVVYLGEENKHWLKVTGPRLKSSDLSPALDLEYRMSLTLDREFHLQLEHHGESLLNVLLADYRYYLETALAPELAKHGLKL